jgi:predicted glycosyltransferase
VRPPADVAAYHLGIANRLFPELLGRLGHAEGVRAIVIPRTVEQRESIAHLGLPSLVVPTRAVDAQSLIAFADLVVSAGGTMNREAVALGVPVYTTFSGRLGGVDEALIREGRLRPLRDVASLPLEKRTSSETRTRRDPARMLELLLSALA